MADEQQQQTAERMEIDGTTDASTLSNGNTVTDAEEVTTSDARDGSASDSTVDAVETKKEAESSSSSSSSKECPFCSAKKMSSGCVIRACKKCCVGRKEDCAAHAKKVKKDPSMKPVSSQAMIESVKKPSERARKPVLKREFKETNFMYYEETVAVFCVRDFLASKKMSQGILNDQVRSLRVKGTYEGKQQRKKVRVRDPEVKVKIATALSKGGAPFSPRHMALVE